MDIAGTGPAEEDLAALVTELGLEQTVRLHGRVSDERRDEIWRRAWLTVVPSVQEGWGLTVLEANQWGVPCVAFDVPGLRDAVIDGTTGWLVGADGTLEETVGHALDILSDRSTADAMAERCRAWSAASARTTRHAGWRPWSTPRSPVSPAGVAAGARQGTRPPSPDSR